MWHGTCARRNATKKKQGMHIPAMYNDHGKNLRNMFHHSLVAYHNVEPKPQKHTIVDHHRLSSSIITDGVHHHHHHHHQKSARLILPNWAGTIQYNSA